MFGYKAVYCNPSLKYMGKVYAQHMFEYVIGETYELDKSQGDMKFGRNGFHFCDFPLDIDRYFKQGDLIVCCLVEILGNVMHDTFRHQSITDKIKIAKLIERDDFFNLFVDGKHKSAYGNVFNISNGKIHGKTEDEYGTMRLFDQGIEYKIDPYSGYIYEISKPYAHLPGRNFTFKSPQSDGHTESLVGV